MVTIDFISFRNVDCDMQTIELSEKIEGMFDKRYNIFIFNYCLRLVHAKNMYFDWKHEDIPDDIKALEIWWDMIISGTDVIECFNYYKLNVPNWIGDELSEAFNKATQIWKPKNERLITEEADEEKDPN